MSINTHSAQYPPDANPLQPDEVLFALKYWHKNGHEQSPLTKLYLFESLQQSTNGSNRHTANLIIQQALEQLAAESAANEDLLRSRFLDNKTAYQVSNDLNIAESTFYLRQKEATVQLTEIIQRLEQSARSQRLQNLLDPLELSSNDNLVAIEGHLDELLPTVTAPNGPCILAIEGIGGIGKTTLANMLVRRLVETDLSWQEIAWVTAQQNELLMSGEIGFVGSEERQSVIRQEVLIEQLFEQLLPQIPRPTDFSGQETVTALKQHLSTGKRLVVIDNLETVDDLEVLLPLLRELSNPTKFILTTRESLYTERDIYHYRVPELSEEEALNLVRREANATNLPHVATATDEDLRPIYATIGGNPLALKLVTGQLHVHGLAEILEDLAEARTTTAENLYTFIYWRAWELLPESARRTLIAMILVSAYGDTIDELLATCELQRSELREALNKLVTLNLVDSWGGLNERRYSIHNLTRSFLHKQVVAWQL